MKLHLIPAAVLATALTIFGPAAPARAELTPSIGVGQIAGDADGAFAAALMAALDAQLAPGGVQATCPVKRLGTDAAALIAGNIVAMDGAVTANVALQGQPAGPDPVTKAEFGPAPSVQALAEMVASDLLRSLCAGGAAVSPVVYDASGGGPQITITGRVTALDREFTLEGSFPGGKAVFTYAPVSPGGGAVSYEISGSGVTGSGEGVYTTVAQADGTVMIEQTTEGCIDGVANTCRTNNDRIVLTPVAP